MKIYNYNPETLEYVGNSVADADPLVPNNWLLPANAVTLEPPEAVEGKTIHFENGSWCYKDIPEPEPEPIQPEPTYAELRAAEYPPMSDYLDGIVKGDQAQVQAYVDACLAVKQKYPKPETNS